MASPQLLRLRTSLGMAIENRRDPPHHHFQELGQAIFVQTRKTGEIGEQHRPKGPMRPVSHLGVAAADFNGGRSRGDRNHAGVAALARPFGTIGRCARDSRGRDPSHTASWKVVGLHDFGAKSRQSHHQLRAIGELLIVIDAPHLGCERDGRRRFPGLCVAIGPLRHRRREPTSLGNPPRRTAGRYEARRRRARIASATNMSAPQASDP